MLEKEKLDGVVVATQPCAHADLVVPVLEAGLHCFAKKPMDTTVEKVDRIVRATRKAKGFYQIGTQRRYNPGSIASLDFVHKGEIGRVVFLQGHWHWTWAFGKMTLAYGGGEIIEQAVPHMDVMLGVMKEQHPIRCVAMATQIEPRPEGPNYWTETHSSANYQFPGGEVFSFTHMFYLPRCLENEKFLVICEKATVDVPKGMLHMRGDDEVSRRLGGTIFDSYDSGSSEQLADFVANIKEGGKRLPRANVETGCQATLMSIMGRMAMVHQANRSFEPSVVYWEEIGSTTEPTA